MRWWLAGGLMWGMCLPAMAWGDVAHQVIALIAQSRLEPAVRHRVDALLRGDTTGLVPTDMVRQSTWADRWRDSDRATSQQRYRQTREWHYVNIALADGGLFAACHGRPALPPHIAPSEGPPAACIVDKIDQFVTVLKDRRQPQGERRRALQFLLHLVGDVHQPLHVGDDRDRGGNDKRVTLPAFDPGAWNLHRIWDVEVVQRLGSDPHAVARELSAGIGRSDRRAWSAGTPADWALESFAVAREHAYAGLPAADAAGFYALPPAYLEQAARAAAQQLQRAGVRLAGVLNGALR